MRERGYEVHTRARYPSPRRPPSRHREYSPRRREDWVKYSLDDQKLPRVERNDSFDRDLRRREGRFSDVVHRDRRFPGIVDRDESFLGIVDRDRRYPDIMDRDRYGVGTRRSRSPQMTERTGPFEKKMYVRNAAVFNYDVGDKGMNGVRAGSQRRLYDEGLGCIDFPPPKFLRDQLSDDHRKSEDLNDKYGSFKCDNYGVGNNYISRGGGEREFYPKKQHMDAGGIEFFSTTHNSASTKSYSLDYEKGGKMHSSTYTLNHDGIDRVTKSYLNANNVIDHMPYVASQHFIKNTDKQGYFHFKNEEQLEKISAEFCDQGKLYIEKKDEGFNYKGGLLPDKLGIERAQGNGIYIDKKVDNLTLSPIFRRSDSGYIASSSRSEDHVPMSSRLLKDSFLGYYSGREIQLPSHGIQVADGLVYDSLHADKYGEKHKQLSPIVSGDRFDDMKSHSRLYNGLPEEMHGDALFPEFGRKQPRDVVEQYVGHMSKFSPSDSMGESYHLKQMGDNILWKDHCSSLVLPIPNNFDAYRRLQPSNYEMDCMCSGSMPLACEREVYRGHENIKLRHHDCEEYDGLHSPVEKSDVSRTEDRSWGSVHGRSQRGGLNLADLGSFKSSERRLGEKYAVNDMLNGHDIEIKISSDGRGARKVYNSLQAGEDIGPASLLKKPKLSRSELGKSGSISKEVAGQNISSSQFIASRLRDPQKSGSRDIKQRLGPVPKKSHVSQRLLKKYQPSVKKRLKSASNKHLTFQRLKSSSPNKSQSIQEDLCRNLQDQGGDHLKDDIPAAVAEPPEISKDFKQLVQSAYFKFLKQINETNGRRKEYLEHGKDCSLKCIVCGSNSNGFFDTESLVMHAFTSKKVGLKSQHLGLYKALCVLMGWKIAEGPCKDWHCDVMSNAEASALKEDLIIWPPIIIVHNSSIDNKKSDERIIISTETLDAKLRGMGFGSILKVRNGKPANQSVMTVKFNGTLSGLQEAERLHQTYVENKHGKVQLKQCISSDCPSSSEVTQVVPADEKFLYGYLGTAEDLSKLDFDTKKRSVVRSKKEILCVVNAS